MAIEEYTIIVNAPRSAEAEVAAAVGAGFDPTHAMFLMDSMSDELGEIVMVDLSWDGDAIDERVFVGAIREKITKATGYTTSTEEEHDAALEPYLR